MKRNEVADFRAHSDTLVGQLANELISNEFTRVWQEEREKDLTYMTFTDFCKAAKMTFAKVVKGDDNDWRMFAIPPGQMRLGPFEA